MSEDGGTDPGSAGTDRGMLRSVKWQLPERLRRTRLRSLLTRQPRDPRPGYIGLYERPDPGRDDVGICCSGGGVRSAAFNLGALQVLQSPEHQVLQRSKYLAAVSGGSYIAAAFCMVAKTWSAKDYPTGERPVRDDDGGNGRGAAQPATRNPSTPAQVHAMAVIRQFPGITVEGLQAALGDADVYGVVGGLARAGQIRRTGGSGGGGVLTPR